MTTTEVDNFPGYPEGVQSFQMMEDIKKQALRFEADIRPGAVTKIDTRPYPFVVEIDGGKTIIEADSVIIATGATAKYLGVKGEAEYMGRGVSACATCDGFFYRKKTGSRGRRRRHGLRRSQLSGEYVRQSLYDRAQEPSARLTCDAEEGKGKPEHRNPFRTRDKRGYRR